MLRQIVFALVLLFIFSVSVLSQSDPEEFYFYDWEDANEATNNWTVSLDGGWSRGSERTYTAGTYSAEYGGAKPDGTYTYNNVFDGSNYDSCIISAYLYIEAAFDSGEYLCLDYSTDGTNFNADSGGGTALCLDGDVDTEDTWTLVSYNVTEPTATMKVRFRANSNGGNEDGNADYINITCYGYTAPVVPTNPCNTTDWNASDYCNITSNFDAGGNPIKIKGLGKIKITADVKNWTEIIAENGADVTIMSGELISR